MYIANFIITINNYYKYIEDNLTVRRKKKKDTGVKKKVGITTRILRVNKEKYEI